MKLLPTRVAPWINSPRVSKILPYLSRCPKTSSIFLQILPPSFWTVPEVRTPAKDPPFSIVWAGAPPDLSLGPRIGGHLSSPSLGTPPHVMSSAFRKTSSFSAVPGGTTRPPGSKTFFRSARHTIPFFSLRTRRPSLQVTPPDPPVSGRIRTRVLIIRLLRVAPFPCVVRVRLYSRFFSFILEGNC